MASQFDATARISVDLGGFRQAANQATKSGNDMTRIFRTLHDVLGRVEMVEKKMATELSRTLRVYNQISQAARNYVTAIQALSKNEASASQGARAMSTAFAQLRRALASVQGMSEKEFQRLQRTLTLYNQMAQALNTLARAQQANAGVLQRQQQLEAQATKERNRAAEASRKLALDEQRLQVARQAAATAAQNAATKQLAAQNQLLRVQNQLAEAQRKAAAAQQQQTSAQANASRGMNNFRDSASGLRDALGDLEGAYRSTIQALTQIGTAAIGAAISHESAFAQVERVTQLTGGELEKMRHEFELLAAELPTSFEETALVAQLASQTGVANEQLIDFTNTVIRFSVTTGVASEQATLMFARIMEMRNIPAGDLENFASTILDLGISSAATEDEILKLSESIATVTDIFGLSIPATLGLASAFANLRIRPELARGSLTRVFAQLNAAMREGGAAGETLQGIMGGTQEQLASLLENDPDSFFLRFAQGMSTTVDQGGLLRQMLRDLGINAVRDIDVISRLANNYDLLAAQVSRARVEFLLGNTLQEQSATIFETTRVEIDNLRESFTNLLARAAGPVATAMGKMANVLRTVLEAASSLGPVIPILGAVTTALALGTLGFVGYRLAVAAAWRGVMAYTQAQSQLAGQSFTLTGALNYLSAAQQRNAQAAAAAAAATTRAAAAQAAAARGVTAFSSAAVAQRGFINSAVSNMAAMSTTAAGLRQNFAASTAALRTQNAALTATAGITTAAAAATTNLNRAAGLYAATSVRVFNVQQGLNNAYAASGAAARSTATATAAAAAATTASATSMTLAGRAAVALSASLTFLRANWLSLLGVAGLLAFAVSSLVLAFRDQKDSMRQASVEAVNAVGGLSAYKDVLIQDTQAAREASGGIDAIGESLKASGTAATEAGRVYRLIAVAQEDLSGSLRDRTERELDMIRVQRDSIELAYGNRDAIEAQAEGTGAMAEAAQEALANLDALTEQEAAYESALNGTTLAIGERAAALVRQQFQESLVNSGLLESRESYEQLSNAIGASGFNIEDILTGDTESTLRQIDQMLDALDRFSDFAARSLNDPRIESSGLADELERLGLTVGEINQLGGPDELADSFRFLRGVIEENQQAFDESQRSASILTELGIDPLNDSLGETDESADIAAEAIEAYEARLAELGETYSALIDPAAAWRGETDEAAQSVEAFTQRLREQVEAQQNFAQNMAVLASQGFGALVEQLQAMGPDGAAAAAELVTATETELRNLELIATQAGEGYVTALAGTMDQLGQLDLGRDAARSISAGIVDELNRTVADGGDLQLASERIIQILQAIDGLDIAPDVVLDILGAQTSLTELETIIRSAQESGALDAEGAAILNTILYENAMLDLQTRIDEVEANHEVDANGQAQLDPQGYYEDLEALRGSAAAAILENLIDVDGDAALSPDNYEAALNLLESLADETTANGDLDVEGEASLLDQLYKNPLGELFRTAAEANRSGKLDVHGAANLSSDGFRNRQLPGVIQAAWNAGAEITRALTRTATVSVYYANVNNPPPSTIKAATGGWIHGPGGPTGDKIPAQLSAGEFVVKASSAKKYAKLVEAINNDRGVTSALSSLQSDTPRMIGSRSTITQAAPRSATRQPGVFDAASIGPTFNITNQYPQAEPTSVSINRSLAYAATISGV